MSWFRVRRRKRVPQPTYREGRSESATIYHEDPSWCVHGSGHSLLLSCVAKAGRVDPREFKYTWDEGERLADGTPVPRRTLEYVRGLPGAKGTLSGYWNGDDTPIKEGAEVTVRRVFGTPDGVYRVRKARTHVGAGGLTHVDVEMDFVRQVSST